jgi:glycosyltransferase involved in cell wall biosynthesis
VRVLCLINSLEPGGAERRLVEMAPLLRERGADVIVSVLRPGGGFDAELASTGMAPVSIDGSGGRAGDVRRLRTLLRTVHPDLLHTTLFDSDLVGRAAAVLERVPVVSSLVNASYGVDQAGEPGVGKGTLRRLRLVDGVTARSVRRFHAVSDFVADVAVDRLRLRPDRIDVVPPGRDEARLGRRTARRREDGRERLGLNVRDVVLLAVARHDYQKGLDVLLTALPTVVTALPRVRLMVSGHESRQTPALHHMRDRCGLTDVVQFLGTRMDVPELLCAADAFVFPSRWEGMSGAVLEAMALEAPIVASDIPPVREAVAGEAGAVLVPRERPDLLASAIIESLIDPAAAASRAAGARQRFLERYTSDRMADGMLRFYERALVR